MYGEDASGRKVSLLNDNDDTPTSITTIKSRNPLFVRPTLPHRSRDSYSASSSSQRSREGSNKSSRSSISCSPRHSPPTPPLVRFDSRSSIQTLKTPSPMSPHYDFDPLDHQGLNKSPQGGLPYYTNGYQQSHGGDDGNPYPSMQDHNAHNYYPGMSAQQPLPPMFTQMDHAFTQQASLQRLQAPSLPQYATNPSMVPFSQPQSSSNTMMSSLPRLQSNPLPIPLSKTKQEPTSTTSTTSATSTTAPVQTDPSTPITTSAATTTAPTKSATATSNGIPSNPASSLPKKKYPCPHAKDFKCTDTFTTSGHAARHGKKHTGEKNVNCPTCGKAFTRKDNMKQHERTHKAGHTGRGSGTGAGPGSEITSTMVAGKANVRRKRTLSGSTMASLTSSPAANLDAEAEDDEDADGDIDMEMCQPQSQSQTSGMKERPSMGKSKLSEILEQVANKDTEMDAEGEADGEGESPGLDALATVAAGEMGGQ